MTRLAIDALGGDHAPEAAVAGAALASLETDLSLVLVGPAARVSELLAGQRHQPDRIAVVDAPCGVSMAADPRSVLEPAGESTSIQRAMALLAAGDCDALVSAGHTGATVLAASSKLARLEGVRRAALAAVYPTARVRGAKGDRFALLLDVGATIEATPEDLVAFALMGSAYARLVSRNDRPRVALLSTGEEENKGPPAVREAHRRLKELAARDGAAFEFLGNVEGVDVPKGRADVVVTDGATGNMAIKLLEGVVEVVRGLAGYAHRPRLLGRVGLAFLSRELDELRGLTDWESYGGAPLLGFDRAVIVAHGRSGPRAVANACKVAAKVVAGDLSGRIGAALR